MTAATEPEGDFTAETPFAADVSPAVAAAAEAAKAGTSLVSAVRYGSEQVKTALSEAELDAQRSRHDAGGVATAETRCACLQSVTAIRKSAVKS